VSASTVLAVAALVYLATFLFGFLTNNRERYPLLVYTCLLIAVMLAVAGQLES
jgi:predicted tellurium resistance membrane protein TerC